MANTPKVVTLDGQPYTPPAGTGEGVNSDAVDLLEIALASAKAGVVTRVAIAMVHDDGSVATCFSTGNQYHQLLSATVILQNRLLKV